ncbi:DUF1800 domain-containing protein [Pararhodobacter sp.]|uniref:DUF1800 domain-containing protein n=1 Tax=Pararhodobacter sp. TaxID=2127056 RepID=UPI002AFEB7A7|nr:DUF1800 domain-containing protein [Pararhodobacter sp.]
MRDIASFIALNRFGLGAAPGDAERIGNDPLGWVLAQITPHQTAPRLYRNRQTSHEILRRIFEANLESPEARRAAIRWGYRQEFNPSLVTRARLMIASNRPFVDRMVMFWSNHFTVSNTQRLIAPAIPAYEREVILPQVFGRFAEMLKAVVRHPCMIVYLDNTWSVGPNSQAGQARARRGNPSALNENLAREILELHTLGVDGGYSQDDIVAFAKVITGWTHGGVRYPNDQRPVQGGFEFRPDYHEPGAKIILGRRYDENGADEGMAVLDDLARHPATARHIATKLVRHFVADDPPADAVAQIAQVFQDTDGDLAEVTRAVVALPQAWADPLAKVKTAYEYVIAVHRAAGRIRATQQDIFQPLSLMGHFPFAAPSPAGWGDTAGHWIAPEALMRRIEWARRFSGLLPASLIPQQFLDDVVGPVASDDLHQWVARAPSGDAALAMILVSPEFQRR